MVIASPAEGGRVTWSSALDAPQEAAAWGRRRTYFFTLHTARLPRERPWHLALRVRLAAPAEDGEPVLQLSVAGHDMSGARAAAHAALLAAFPAAAAPSGWPVHLHLLDV